MGHLGVRQRWKPWVQVKAPRESASGTKPRDDTASGAGGQRGFCEDQTREVKNVWRPGRDSVRVTKEEMQDITCV